VHFKMKLSQMPKKMHCAIFIEKDTYGSAIVSLISY